MKRLSDDKVIYKVGDTVTIRDWRDMMNEYGYNISRGYIRMPFEFNDGMHKYCGEKAEVTQAFFSECYDCMGYKLSFREVHSRISFKFGSKMFVETYTEPNYDLRDKFAEGGFDAELI